MPDQNFLNSTQQSLAWFKQRIDADEIALQPAFQREAVWTDAQKSYLIDTVLRGLPVPEMYLQTSTGEDGTQNYIVVDGQQRLRACRQFWSNQLTLIGEDVGGKVGSKFDDLSSDEKKSFFAYKFVVRSLPEMEEFLLRDIFKRINKNTVILNPQEIRHATYWGEFIKSTEMVANSSHWAGLGIFNPNDIRRMRHVEFVSEIYLARIYGDQNKKANLEKAYEAFESEFEGRSLIERSLLDAVRWISENFQDFPRYRWRKKTDAYTLLVTLSDAGYGSKMIKTGYLTDPLDVVQRLRVKAADVDSYLRSGVGADLAVKTYADAVERAASDLSNRRERRLVLESWLSA